MKKPEYLFPVALEDTIPFDLADVQHIRIGDHVAYERLNDIGDVVIRAFGSVVNINYTTQSVQLRVSPALRFWVSVDSVSLAANGTAATAATAAVPAA